MRLRTSRSRGRGISSLYSGAARWLLVVCAAAAIGPALAGRSLQQTQSPAGSKGGQPFTPTKPSVKRYEWTISYTKAAPDCFEKNVVVVNGRFQPTIRVHIKNDLPPDYPSSTNGGVTIHWHGFSQRDEPWQDGVAYVQQCPILPGEEFTYRFLVTDSPGTYFWHDHASGNHADGLSGLLIVEPEDNVPALDQYDEERTVYLHDWFHTQGDVLGMSLNRPLDKTLQNASTGAWEWVNVPQAILINQRGSFYDCPLGPPQTPAVTPTCAVNNYTIPAGLAGQPMASASNPGCSHASLTVQQNKTYLIRIVNAGTLDMESLCFQGHNVTIVAADATPVEPLEVECVDVNLGQRYDVLLKTDMPVANYWMRSASQYRAGSPDGYGVLHYEGAPNDTLPDAQLPQPGSTPPFKISTINSLKSRGVLFDPQAAQNVSFLWPGNQTTLAVPNASRGFKLDISQPLLNQARDVIKFKTGQLKWGINNIVHAETPTCSALLEEVVDNPDFVEQNLPNANGFGNGALGTQTSGDVAGGQNLYTNYTFPMTPMAGRHLIQIAQGEVIDVVIQNHEASDFNGAGRGDKRNGSEQHPFHLHGQLLGTGEGTYDPSNATLNTLNPMYRDTATVPPYGWVVFRFLADNPGLWLLHCHVYWHQYMGQTVAFAVSPDKVKQPPKNLPKCPKTCPAQFAPWRPSYVQKTYGRLPYEIPLNTVG